RVHSGMCSSLDSQGRGGDRSKGARKFCNHWHECGQHTGNLLRARLVCCDRAHCQKEASSGREPNRRARRRTRLMLKTGTVALLSLFLTGCTVGPKYKRPALQPPTNFYAERQISTSSEADLAWWDLFKDPVLQGLIREGLKNNYDLQIALARVEQERALAGVTRSQYFPQVGYGASI